jgi:uncharacterized protein involved in outer membrane biogenesis
VSKGRKVFIGCAVAIIAVALVLAVVVPRLVDVDRYRPQVIAHIQEETGKPAAVGHLTLRVFPSLSIRVDGFALGNPPGFPQGKFVEVRRIYAVVDASALWNRQVIITSLEFDEPSINLLSDSHGHWNFENPPKRSAARATDSKPFVTLGVISKVRLAGGRLTVAGPVSPGAAGSPYIEARGVSSQLQQVDLNAFSASAALERPPAAWGSANPSSLGASLLYAATPQAQPAAHGTLNADWVRFQQLQATSVKSQLRLFPKQVYVDDLRFDICSGRATGDLSFNFAGPNLRYSGRARLAGLDVAKLLAAFPGLQGKMTGSMDGNAEVGGELLHTSEPLAGVRGTGQATIRNGQMPSLQLNKNLMLLARLSDLGPASGDPSSFSSLAADFNIADQKIASRKVTLVGNGVNVESSGTLGVAGAGSLEYEGVASLAAGRNPMTDILAGLSGARLEGGRLTFPFAVAGTLASPHFALKSTAGTGQPVAPGQAQQPADLLQGISNLLKKKKP